MSQFIKLDLNVYYSNEYIYTIGGINGNSIFTSGGLCI